MISFHVDSTPVFYTLPPAGRIDEDTQVEEDRKSPVLDG